MQNKANVNIGKINISIVTKKDYDKEQRTTNNDRYSKQTQTKPISNATTVFSAYYTRDCRGPLGLVPATRPPQ
jgi:hypothetical protein